MSKIKDNYEREVERFIFEMEKSKFDEEQRRKRLRQKTMALYSITMVYIAVTMSTLLFFNINDSDFFSIFLHGESRIDEQRIITLESTLSNLEKRFAIIANTGASTIELSQMKAELEKIKDEQQTIKETIIGDYDLALTSRLLREKQSAIESELHELKSAQYQLNEKFDDFMVSIFTIPLVGAVMTALIGLIAWLFQRLWVGSKNSESSDSSSERFVQKSSKK